MLEMSLIFVMLALAWFWLDALAVRERAESAGKRACREEGLQFLDDTVAFVGLGFGRDEDSHLKFRRSYRFEFSDTGDNRLMGMVVMLGREVETLDLEHRYIEVMPSQEVPPRVSAWRWEGAPRPRHGHRGRDDEES